MAKVQSGNNVPKKRLRSGRKSFFLLLLFLFAGAEHLRSQYGSWLFVTGAAGNACFAGARRPFPGASFFNGVAFRPGKAVKPVALQISSGFVRNTFLSKLDKGLYSEIRDFSFNLSIETCFYTPKKHSFFRGGIRNAWAPFYSAGLMARAGSGIILGLSNDGITAEYAPRLWQASGLIGFSTRLKFDRAKAEDVWWLTIQYQQWFSSLLKKDYSLNTPIVQTENPVWRGKTLPSALYLLLELNLSELRKRNEQRKKDDNESN